MNLKQDIIAALKTATEPMDRTAIAQLCLAGTDKQVADQLYLLKKAGEIVGEKERGSYRYRMPTTVEVKAAQEAPWVAPKGDLRVPSVAESPAMTSAVLSARSEVEVDDLETERIEAATADEIERESIEAAKLMRRLSEEISGEPKKLPPREVIERMIADRTSKVDIDVWWPGPTLAERMAAANEMKSQPESAVSETVEDETEEPIEPPPFRVGFYSNGTMVLLRNVESFQIDKIELAELVEFARTVGWLGKEP